MLGLFGPEVVHFFEMTGNSLAFVSAKAKKPETDLKVRFSLVGYKAKHVDIPLKILESQALGKSHLSTGSIEMAPEHCKQLEELLYNYSTRPDLGEAARRSPRLPIGLKAISRELPGYNCVTTDISRHGVRLTCHGPVELGTKVQISLDTDLAALPNLTLNGRVVGCQETKDSRSHNKSYHISMDFAGLPAAQVETLDYYNRTLAGRLKGDVMQRQIADGEMTAGPPTGGAPLHLGAPPPPPPT
ncbi:MAG: PilZ domain-containing protein [Candidatus Eremiobacteraeota bacterium]|nr:PilZ domain-containing protein [Candidatus Eremiobacteraeota bacterium]